MRSATVSFYWTFAKALHAEVNQAAFGGEEE